LAGGGDVADELRAVRGEHLEADLRPSEAVAGLVEEPQRVGLVLEVERDDQLAGLFALRRGWHGAKKDAELPNYGARRAFQSSQDQPLSRRRRAAGRRVS